MLLPEEPVKLALARALRIRKVTFRDLDEIAKYVRKKFPAKTVILPLPDEHSLLVYVTDEEAKETFGDWESPRPYIRIVPQPQ